ncbi:hypothetical protein ACHAPJ_009758 [Fusarium lateritium]
MEGILMQQKLDPSHVPTPSDTEALTVNITVPSGSDRGSSLPVIAFIHGGGFAIGANWYPQYDQRKFVALSACIGSPVIAVNIGFRIGVPGFLSSEAMRKAGYRANRGIVDQKNALRWVAKNIAGFGGNPDAVTLIGQSAGAACIMYHLQADEPLFSQAVLLGGTSTAIRPVSLEVAEDTYENALDTLGIQEEASTSEEKLEALKNLSVQDIQAKSSPAIRAGAVVDGEVVPHVISFDSLGVNDDTLLPGRKWCSRLFTVDSKCDASIAAVLTLFPKMEGIKDRFQESMRLSLGQETAEAISKYYGLTDVTNDAEALDKIVGFLSDVQFHGASLAVAEIWPEAFVGYFNEGNPWAGPFYGQANHLLDVAYLWQNFNLRLSEKQVEVAESFASDIIRFAAKTELLPNWKDTRQAVSWGPSEEGLVRSVETSGSPRLKRDGSFMEISQSWGGLEALLQAGSTFIRT